MAGFFYYLRGPKTEALQQKMAFNSSSLKPCAAFACKEHYQQMFYANSAIGIFHFYALVPAFLPNAGPGATKACTVGKSARHFVPPAQKPAPAAVP